MQLAEIKRALAGLRRPVDIIEEYWRMLDNFDALHRDQQRVVVDTLMMVELRRAPRGRKGFALDTVSIIWNS